MNPESILCIEANLAEYHRKISIEHTLKLDFVRMSSINRIVTELRQKLTAEDLIDYNWIVDELTNFDCPK